MSPRLHARRLVAAALFCNLLAAAAAQVTLFTEDFEGVTPPALPAGWVDNQFGYANTVINPSSAGSNNSVQVYHWSLEDQGAGQVPSESPAIDITAYTTGYSFTLSFDLLANSTTDHSFIIGIGKTSSTGPTAWIIADSTASGALATPHVADLSATDTWQTFSFDISSEVSTYLGSNPASEFTLFFLDWAGGPGTTHTTAFVDNIKLIAVPEPSTYAALAGLAALGFAVRRRRRTA